jgi:hypothetical protein
VLLGGFIGAAYGVGGLAGARLRSDGGQPYVRLFIGILIILTPLLLARMFSVVGGPMYLFAGIMAGIAFLVEYVAWTMGFGAALMGMFGRWRSSRGVTTDAGGSTTTDSTDARGFTTTDSTDSTVL